VTFVVSDGSHTSDEITTMITINKPPAIAAPQRDVPAGGNFVFLIGEIISDPDNNLDLSTLSIASKRGAQTTISGNFITVNYSVLDDFEGTDELTISVCDVGGQCETQVVAIEVNADIDVFNGISANTDGMNDFMKIRFLPAGSSVAIFNRWGDVVFENDDYDSNDAGKRFEGNSSDGKELASGTYYYKVTLPDGKKRTGYLQLKR
jgi:gliding motility-associated-like protein